MRNSGYNFDLRRKIELTSAFCAFIKILGRGNESGKKNLTFVFLRTVLLQVLI